MANEEHLARLKEGVEVWNKWRTDSWFTRPNLAEADLREADLSGANLWEADLTEANLQQANLQQQTSKRTSTAKSFSQPRRNWRRYKSNGSSFLSGSGKSLTARLGRRDVQTTTYRGFSAVEGPQCLSARVEPMTPYLEGRDLTDARCRKIERRDVCPY
jgi:uncharacterized protein YjbI with pentapeptide repeats